MNTDRAIRIKPDKEILRFLIFSSLNQLLMQTVSTRINLVHADDHSIFREGFKLIINQTKHGTLRVIGEAENGATLLERVHALKPDVAFVDVHMPGMNGIDATRNIKERFADVKVVGLSTYSERSIVEGMLQAGADGYLLKNASYQEIEQAAITVKNGGAYFSSNEEVQSALRVGKKVVPPLGDREIEVLKLLCEGKSNKEVATDLGISKRTVETYRERLQQKTSTTSFAQLVIYAIRKNLFKL